MFSPIAKENFKAIAGHAILKLLVVYERNRHGVQAPSFQGRVDGILEGKRQRNRFFNLYGIKSFAVGSTPATTFYGNFCNK